MVGSSVPMNVRQTVRVAAATCVLTLAWVSLASAEIVIMSSGRTVSVKGHKNAGQSVILTLRSGGEVTLDATLIEKIVPDEVPYPEPVQAATPVKETPTFPAPSRGAQLRDSIYNELI